MSLAENLKTFAAAVESNNGRGLSALFTAKGIYDDYFFGPSKPGPDGIAEMLAHFHEGGAAFKWEFFDVVEAGPLGYASYRFSYDSILPESKGARVVFEGISRFELEGGKIKRYSEVFDRGSALAQLDFAPERLKKISLKYAAALKAKAESKAHLKG
ncbi:MAG: nuclear transport factor 2 family protein [Hyphomicrobiaceae bacterium]